MYVEGCPLSWLMNGRFFMKIIHISRLPGVFVLFCLGGGVIGFMWEDKKGKLNFGGNKKWNFAE